ncbi:MAG: alpha/beta hydrolase [Pseudomonadales bacterium]
MRLGRGAAALGLILAGTLLAAYVQTDGGAVTVHDVRFVGATGNGMSGLLYVPDGARPESPAPAVLAVHGYINSRETQSGFAIELARRGVVVLALDQTGHGYSDPPAFAAGFGGPDGLAHLRGLGFVDARRIGLEGHSMGGWAVQMAAASQPDGYAAMVLEGSSTGTFGAPDGTPETPRNLAVVFSRYDEFSALMWDAGVPADIVDTAKLKTLFGTAEPVRVGELYGDPAAGTARLLAMPAVTHPGDHLSSEAIGAAVAWFQARLAVTGPAPLEQVWYWKELATLIALAGLLLLIFPVFDRLLGWRAFAAVRTDPVATVTWSRGRGAVNLLVTALLPVLLFFPLQTAAESLLPANPLLPQQITNGILLWAWGSGLVSLALFAVWLRGSGHSLGELGLPLSLPLAARAAGLALGCCGVLYLVVVAAAFFLDVDFRFWVVALKTMAPFHVPLFLIYLPLFAVFFLVLSLCLHTQLGNAASWRRDLWRNGLVLSGGFVLLLVLQYTPLLLGGTLLLPSQPLLTIVAFQFVVLLAVVAVVSTYCFARTNNVYAGAFLNSVFVTWYIVAGTATQAVPFWF